MCKNVLFLSSKRKAGHHCSSAWIVKVFALLLHKAFVHPKILKTSLCNTSRHKPPGVFVGNGVSASEGLE